LTVQIWEVDDVIDRFIAILQEKVRAPLRGAKLTSADRGPAKN